jgi:PKD repeat protein
MMRSTKILLQLAAGLALSFAWLISTGATGAHAQALTCTSVLPTPTDIVGLSGGYTSANGCYTVYDTQNYSLLPGETYHYRNVFVYDRVSGATKRISINPDGTPLAREDSLQYLAISPNGRYILFGNFGWNDDSVYLHDRDADRDGIFDEPGVGNTSNTLLPMSAGGVELQPAINCMLQSSGGFSADGNTIVFGRCYATGTFGGTQGIFIYTINNGAVNKITNGINPRISGDGRYILYAQSTNLPGSGDSYDELYRWDRDSNGNGTLDDSTPTPQLASVNDQGDPGDWGVNSYYQGMISKDGRYVAFESNSRNLVPDDQNSSTDVFVHDFVENTTTRISLTNDGYPLNDYSNFGGLSDDGRFVSFSSVSDAAVAWDDNHAADLFLRDRTLGTTTLITGKADRNLTVFEQEQAALSLTLYGPTEGGLNRDYSFSATLANQSGAMATAFTWQVTDVSGDIVHSGVSAAADQVTLQWSTAGAKTVRLTASTPDGPVSASHTFTVYAPPTADFQADATMGTNELTSHFTNISTGEYRTAFWDFGDNDNGSNLSGSPSYDFEPGTYTVSLTVSGPGGSSTKVRTDYIHVEGSNPTHFDRSITHIGSLGLPLTSYLSSAWGDFDMDGVPELLISGCSQREQYSGACAQPFTRIYRNQDGVFTDIHAGLAGLMGNVNWVDLDGDGRLDVFVRGFEAGADWSAAVVYRNLGNGLFLRFVSGLPYSDDADDFQWVDYNRDGYPDAVTEGKLYRNSGGVFQDTNIRFATSNYSADWGDYNADGYPDLLTTSLAYGSSQTKTRLFRNDGGTFTEIDANTLGLPDVGKGIVSWVDYDHDGTLDVLIGGQGASGYQIGLYHNENGAFTDLHLDLSTVRSAWQTSWADFDHDGDLDLLTNDNLYRNDGGAFTNVDLDAYSMYNCSSWVDFDRDGVLDLENTSGGMDSPNWGDKIYGSIQFFRSATPTSNPAPSIPGSPTLDLSGGKPKFTWSASTDDPSNPEALTYTLRLSTTQGVVSSLSPNPDTHMGNAGERTQVTLDNLPSGKTYYWSVQAVDEGLATSGFSAEQTFTMPGIAVSDLTITGETLAFPNKAYTFTATLSPGNATLPVTYTWQADGQTQVTHSGVNFPYDSASFTWANTGDYTITVSADNGQGQPFSKQLNVKVSMVPRPNFTVNYSTSLDTLPLTNLQFRDQSTGTVTGWAWDFGDGQTSTEQNPIHEYAAVGDYTVALTASGPDGSRTITLANCVHIHNPVHASISVSPAGNHTAPLPLTFTNTSTGDIKNIQWDFDGGYYSTENTVTRTYSTSGSYSVTLFVYGLGNDSSYISMSIPVHSNSHAAFHMDKSVGVTPMTVHFTNDSTGDFTSSSWHFGYEGTSTETNPTFTFNSGYSSIITLTITGPTGSDSVSQEIYMYPPISAAFTANPGTSGAAPFSVSFYNSAYWNATSSLWDFGDGTTSTDNCPFHVFREKGTYTVTLTITGRGGDVKTETKVINVYNATHSAFHTDVSTGWAPLTVKFTNDSSGDFSTSNWEFGDGETSTDANPVHIYTHYGNYTAKLTVSGPGGTNQSSQTVQVYDLAQAAFYTNSTWGIAPLTVRFINTSSGTFSTSSWDFGDGAASLETSPSHTYALPGSYPVTLTVSGAGGMSQTGLTIQVYGPAKAAFHANVTSGPAPLTVQFSDDSTGDYGTHRWDFGDGATSTEANPVHVFSQPGTYTIQLSITGLGGTDEISLTDYIQVSPGGGDIKTFIPAVIR